VNLCLERGSFTVVAGASGAGKTTLLRALLGQVPLEAGEIRWNGALLNSPLVTSTSVAGPARVLTSPQVAYVAQASACSTGMLEQMIQGLLPDCELWVVDDLAGVLDERQEEALWDWVFCQRLFWRRGTCLAVSNRQPALSRADHIVILSEGRVVGEGRLESLLQTCAEMRRILSRP